MKIERTEDEDGPLYTVVDFDAERDSDTFIVWLKDIPDVRMMLSFDGNVVDFSTVTERCMWGHGFIDGRNACLSTHCPASSPW